jgi:diguanylate cyclase (GGDEF)-like protein
MNLRAKITLFLSALGLALIAVLVAVSLYSFRGFSLVMATEHVHSAAEIVRVSLTESMINGVIKNRESFLVRLKEVEGLESARVVRSSLVEKQFGKGLLQESPADDIERSVLTRGKPIYEVTERHGAAVFRGTIPFTATAKGTPNCLQCHQVQEGDVLGAVTLTISLEKLKTQAIITVGWIVGIVAFFALFLVLVLRRLVLPIAETARNVEKAVQRALNGDFKTHVKCRTHDEIGQIANDMNRLLAFLDGGLNHIGRDVARLTNRTQSPGENLLTATVDAVDILTKAAHFKQAIEEDETKAEIYRRLARVLASEYDVHEYSIYETVANKNQLVPLIVDDSDSERVRWCDPQILVRSDSCRACRTGHLVDGVTTPNICYAFQPPNEAKARTHICVPLIQSGTVGCVIQLVVDEQNKNRVLAQLPFISVYLREAAPVIEARRLMDTLRDSNLRDPMTGLNNRRFLEEFVDTLVASVQRRATQLSILMLDLDYFKMVNDTYGHDAGDTVLKTLAQTLKQSVRASDMVIRYGGEEFMIILLDTGAKTAVEISETIRSRVEALKVPIGTTSLQKTISIGVAEFPADSETFWQAVKFADVALYRAKESGRNRVIRFEPSMWTGGEEQY